MFPRNFSYTVVDFYNWPLLMSANQCDFDGRKISVATFLERTERKRSIS